MSRLNVIAIVLAAALLGGAYWLGQRSAADREREFLAQLRLTRELAEADRRAFLEAIRSARPGSPQPISINLPSLNIPSQTRIIESGPRTIRIETEVKQPVSPEKATDLEKAGATSVTMTIKPRDLRNEPEEKRRATAVQDPTSGAFVCVEGNLCEKTTTRQTVPKSDPAPPESRLKLAGGFPTGIGIAYELVRFEVPLIGRLNLDGLVFTYPNLSGGAGISKPVSRSFDVGIGFVGGNYTGGLIYATWSP